MQVKGTVHSKIKSRHVSCIVPLLCCATYPSRLVDTLGRKEESLWIISSNRVMISSCIILEGKADVSPADISKAQHHQNKPDICLIWKISAELCADIDVYSKKMWREGVDRPVWRLHMYKNVCVCAGSHWINIISEKHHSEVQTSHIWSPYCCTKHIICA